MKYRRSNTTGGTLFFTVNLQDRSLDLLVRHVDALRAATRKVQARYPFEVLAAVVLPDHLHAIWRLPEGESDFGLRWSLIKAGFSRGLPAGEWVGPSRQRKRERGVWQRRYWEHQIRDERDLEAHVDYAHFNPVKHGLVSAPIEWPYSSLHRFVRQGLRAPDWGEQVPEGASGFGER